MSDMSEDSWLSEAAAGLFGRLGDGLAQAGKHQEAVRMHAAAAGLWQDFDGYERVVHSALEADLPPLAKLASILMEGEAVLSGDAEEKRRADELYLLADSAQSLLEQGGYPEEKPGDMNPGL